DTTIPKDGTDNDESEYYNVVGSTVGGEVPSFARVAAADKPTASVNAATPGIVPTKGMPRLLTPPTTSLNTAGHRRELAATPSFTPFSSVQKHTPATPIVEPSPGWDCTKTTVSSDLLESVLATPKEEKDVLDDVMEELPMKTNTRIEPLTNVGEGRCVDDVQDDEGCDENENAKDISVVSSNWDPLQVSMNQEIDIVGVGERVGEEESDRDRESGEVGEEPVHGLDECSNFKLSPSEKSNNSRQSFTSTSSTFGEIPTVAEVTNFMSQLKQLRQENSPAAKKITFAAERVEQMPVESQKADESNEDNVECAMPLLEYKEWLRQHQLDTNRKNSVIYEQLKAIRCKVYGESDFGGNSGNAEVAAEGNCNQVEGIRFPGESKMQLAEEVTSVKSISPANSFVKENTLIGENAKDPAINFDRTPAKTKAQESSCFPTDEKRNMYSPSDNTSPAGQQQQHQCFPTDEKRMGLPSETISVDGQQNQLSECRRDAPQLSPLVPAAHWSGGLARWGPSNDTNTLPSPSIQQPEQQKKLKIAINEDDFSFKPPSLTSATGKQIVISPIVTGTVAAAFGNSASTRFNFTLSPDDNHSKTHTPSSSHPPMGSLSAKSASSDLGTNDATQSKPTYSPSSKISLSPVTSKQRSNIPARTNKSSSVPLNEASAAVLGSDGLLSCSIPEEGASYAQKLTPPDDLQMIASSVSKSPKGADLPQQFQKASSEVSSVPYASSSASPDMSEGDKGGGFSYNYPPLRSDVTTTSSKFVELGQQNNGEEEEEDGEDQNVASTSPSLLGVTVVGSKSKRKKCKQREARSFPLAQTVEEQDSLCSTHESESQSSNQEALLDNDDSNVSEAKANSSARKPLDPDGYDWKELDSKQNEAKASIAIGLLGVIPENEDLDILAGGAKKSTMKSPTPSNSLDIFPETDDECRIAAEDRVKTCFTPRATDTSNNLPTKNELDVTNDTIYLTPQSSFHSKLEYSRERNQGVFVSSGIRELQSVFMSSESASSVSSKDYIKRSAPPDESSRCKPYDGIESTSSQYISENWTEAKQEPDLNSFSFGAASLVVAEKEVVPSPPPDSKSIVEILNVTSEDDMNGSKSSETKSIKELRSIFEPLQKESQNIREGLRNQFTGSTVIGRGVYLKNRDLQTMSSLGSETYDTLESSMGKITANGSTVGEGSIGDGTLNTKKIIRYAKHLEQRGHLESEEQDSFKSFENMIEKKDTSNSSKENQTAKGTTSSINAGNIADDDVDVPNTSSLEALKNVFESKSNIRSVGNAVAPKQLVMNESAHLIKQMPERKNTTHDGWLLRRKASSLSAKNVAPSSGDVVAAAAPMHAESPATSVKDRIAVFSGKKSASVGVHSQSPIKVLRQQHASPNKVVAPLQQQSSIDMNRGLNQGASFHHQAQMPTGRGPVYSPLQHQSKTPPRMINTTATPSPMPVANQSNWSNKPVYGIHSSPYLHSVNGSSRSSYNAPMPARFPTPNRPAHIVTQNESINTSNYDIDDDDGITLSPTFSEVSGLTLPTCLGTVK
ncbi:hypothetical protein ACHAWU_002047, partial [Discostella pseudostelligera]